MFYPSPSYSSFHHRCIVGVGFAHTYTPTMDWCYAALTASDVTTATATPSPHRQLNG